MSSVMGQEVRIPLSCENSSDPFILYPLLTYPISSGRNSLTPVSVHGVWCVPCHRVLNIYIHLVAPHIVNLLHRGVHIFWIMYVPWWKLGLIVRNFLMFGFGSLILIFIIIAILTQNLLLFHVCVHSCSSDTTSVFLGQLDHHVSGIFSDWFQTTVHT